MPADAESKHSSREIDLAKTEALDRFFSKYIEEFASTWDVNFLASIKDWQVKGNRPLTIKQADKLAEIYRTYSMHDDYYREFLTGAEFDYKAYLG